VNFNHWDIILFIPLLYAAVKGFRKGLIIELASVAALIAGIYVAANCSEWTAGKLTEWFEIEGTWLGYLSFFLTFCAVVFGIYALAKVIEKAVNIVALKLVNKLLGMLFGTIKMILILSVLLNLLSWLDQHVPLLHRSSPEKSLLFKPILHAAPAVMPVLTESEWMRKAEGAIGPLFEQEKETAEGEPGTTKP